MNIYIDESGNFITTGWRDSKISCVAALILPTSQADQIFNEYLNLRSSWKHGCSEIKGSKLNESQMDQVISFLSKQDVFVELCGIDMSIHTENQITDFKQKQADRLIANITPEIHANAVKELHEERDKFLSLPNQLFVQIMANLQLLLRVIENSTLYYCSERPEEMGVFHWIVDAKDNKIKMTKYEKLLYDFVPAFLAPICLPELIKGADYSYFKNFCVPENEIKYRHPWLPDEPLKDQDGYYVDIKKIFRENFEFKDSRDDAGLQLVDFIASCFTRAMNGKLSKSGWKNLGSLIINRPSKTAHMIRMHNDQISKPRNYRKFVLQKIEEKN